MQPKFAWVRRALGADFWLFALTALAIVVVAAIRLAGLLMLSSDQAQSLTLGAVGVLMATVLAQTARRAAELAEFRMVRAELIGIAHPTSLVSGNKEVYEAARDLVSHSPRGARFRATSFWFYGSGPEYPGVLPYDQALLAHLSDDRLAEYRRAVSISPGQDWERLRPQVTKTLNVPNATTQLYDGNPLAFDCLIGDQEALLALPAKGTYPLLHTGIVIRQPDVVRALQNWYDDFIWNSDIVPVVQVKTESDLDENARRLGWT